MRVISEPGKEVSIAALVQMLADVSGFKGQISFDRSKPDGRPRKLMDVSRLASMGWRAQTPLSEGIKQTYRWYLANKEGWCQA